MIQEYSSFLPIFENYWSKWQCMSNEKKMILSLALCDSLNYLYLYTSFTFLSVLCINSICPYPICLFVCYIQVWNQRRTTRNYITNIHLSRARCITSNLWQNYRWWLCCHYRERRLSILEGGIIIRCCHQKDHCLFVLVQTIVQKHARNDSHIVMLKFEMEMTSSIRKELVIRQMYFNSHSNHKLGYHSESWESNKNMVTISRSWGVWLPNLRTHPFHSLVHQRTDSTITSGNSTITSTINTITSVV